MANKETKGKSGESTDGLTVISMSEFYKSIPPNQNVIISDVSHWREAKGYGYIDTINTPDIELHCSNEVCNGTRVFRCLTEPLFLSEFNWKNAFITYRCSNCKITKKVFSIAISFLNEKDDQFPKDWVDKKFGHAFKFGEYPVYGPPTPTRLMRLIRADRELFLQGRHCENQGLGIGAFIYYRRVVENQRNCIFDEIIKVAKKLNAKDDDITELENAKNEKQFSKSLGMVKKGIPQILMIK